MNAIIHFPNTGGEIIAEPNEEISILSFHLSAEFLSSILNADDSLGDDFSNILSGSQDLIYSDFDFMTAEMKQICESIIHNKKSKIANSMFIEAKVLELISLHLEQLYLRNTSGKIELNDENSFLATEIKQHIIENIISPPSIMELSARYSLTHTRLNQIFRAETGLTVFEFLRQYRLELTRNLLLERKYNISEISYLAGWSSPAHLSREFKKKFGVNPKNFGYRGLGLGFRR